MAFYAMLGVKSGGLAAWWATIMLFLYESDTNMF